MCRPFAIQRNLLHGILLVPLLLGSAIGPTLLVSADEPGAGSSRPNIIFILTDDQRWDQLGCAGHPFLKTPHIDRLAQEGVRFANAFVTTSLCSPSRASFLSGLYANTHGVIDNFTDYPHELPSFPRRLHESGYHTAYVGKWHMGEDDDSPRPGFDDWISHQGQGNYFDNEFNINGTRKSVPGYYTHVVTTLASEWLKSDHGGRPFLLILGHKAPHTPFTPEPQYAHAFDNIDICYPRSAFNLTGKPQWVEARLDTWHGIYGPIYGFRQQYPDRSAAGAVQFGEFVKAYTATIRSVDDSVGQIYQTLADLKQLDNTIIVYAGDNGMFLGEHGMTDKRAMHEPSIRIPLIVRYPKLVPAGKIITHQVLNIDLAPSLLQMAGVPPLDHIHGQSWVSLLQGKTDGWRTSWYYEYNYEAQFPYTPNVRGVRTDRWKYIHYPPGDGGPDPYRAELYDLQNDPGELHNLIDDPQYAEVVNQLQTELKQLVEQTGGKSYQKMPRDEGIKSQLPDAKVR